MRYSITSVVSKITRRWEASRKWRVHSMPGTKLSNALRFHSIITPPLAWAKILLQLLPPIILQLVTNCSLLSRYNISVPTWWSTSLLVLVMNPTTDQPQNLQRLSIRRISRFMTSNLLTIMFPRLEIASTRNLLQRFLVETAAALIANESQPTRMMISIAGN
jgi:hypothetical protein